jgi:hypothetical protein
MPRAKRSPIDYTPQFGAGIFRPKETIAQELAELAEESPTDTAEEFLSDDGVSVTDDLGQESNRNILTQQSTSARTNDATTVRTNERTKARTRVRHSFDIWQDQLLGLSEIQAERFSRTGRKPKLGDLAQEALDAFIAKERKRPNVRTNER